MTNKAIKLRKHSRRVKEIRKRNPSYVDRHKEIASIHINPWRKYFSERTNFEKVKIKVQKYVDRHLHLTQVYWYLIPKLKETPRKYQCKGTSSSKNVIAKQEALQRLKRIYQ